MKEMNHREWVMHNLSAIEDAYARAMAILSDPEKANVHEIVVDAVADMVIAKAFLESSLPLRGA
jgi:AmiR/NasT family two-component response regulator